MNINQEVVQSRWKEVKGAIRNKWSNLSDEELEVTKGNVPSLLSLIEKKTSMSKDDASHKLYDLTERFATKQNESNDKSNERSFDKSGKSSDASANPDRDRMKDVV